jgi:hypothetical protein
VGSTGRAIAIGGAVGLIALVVLFLASRSTGLQPTAPVPPTVGQASPAGSEITPATPTAGSASATATATEPAAAVLVGAGDISECDNDRDAATADLVETVDGVVIALGDNVYEDGTLKEYQRCYDPTWGRPSIRDRTMPIVGNHEYNTPDAAGYFRYFGAAAGDPDEGWYAFDAGAWRVYALNSNCAEVGGCGAGSAQELWLRNDLAANPRRCVAALAHHPRFSSGQHGDNDVMADLWRTLQQAGAELMLSGHDHSYERFAPQDAAGRADEAGLVQLVVGTGGRDPYPFAATRANSVVKATPVFGVIRLELRPDSYAFEFLPIEGIEFSDAGTADCH